MVVHDGSNTIYEGCVSERVEGEPNVENARVDDLLVLPFISKLYNSIIPQSKEYQLELLVCFYESIVL